MNWVVNAADSTQAHIRMHFVVIWKLQRSCQQRYCNSSCKRERYGRERERKKIAFINRNRLNRKRMRNRWKAQINLRIHTTISYFAKFDRMLADCVHIKWLWIMVCVLMCCMCCFFFLLHFTLPQRQVQTFNYAPFIYSWHRWLDLECSCYLLETSYVYWINNHLIASLMWWFDLDSYMNRTDSQTKCWTLQPYMLRASTYNAVVEIDRSRCICVWRQMVKYHQFISFLSSSVLSSSFFSSSFISRRFAWNTLFIRF